MSTPSTTIPQVHSTTLKQASLANKVVVACEIKYKNAASEGAAKTRADKLGENLKDIVRTRNWADRRGTNQRTGTISYSLDENSGPLEVYTVKLEGTSLSTKSFSSLMEDLEKKITPFIPERKLSII